MTISSMTGFARREGAFEAWRWAFEIKSVNSRNFEPRLRLPASGDRIEAAIRRELAAKVARGHVSVVLTLRRADDRSAVRLNRAAFEQALRLVEEVRQRIDAAPPRAEAILALRGVLEESSEADDEASNERLDAALLASFREALSDFCADRAREGAALAAVLRGLIDGVSTLAAEARSTAAAQPQAIRDRIARQLADLLPTGVAPAERLAEEAAMIALRADIREELDRLDAHVAGARELLAGAAPAGRRLDFLAQEFNREANTLCSKAQDMTLKRLGLDLKTLVDQLREQAQNVE